MSKQASLSHLHSMNEFGVVPELTNTIRVNSLKDRLVPSIPFPHKHDFYQIMVVTAGSGWHEVDFKRERARAGTVFIMKPVQVHSWELAKSTQGVVIEFNSLASYPDLNLLPDAIAIKKAAFLRIQELAQGMLSDFNLKKSKYEIAIQSALTLMFVLIEQIVVKRPSKDSEQDSFYLRLTQLIEKDFKKHHEIHFYADSLKVSPKVLTMRCTRLTGLSPRDHLHARLLLEAKRLLAYSALSVSEVGYELGFEDPNYFARFFKKLSKLTPLEFRSKVKA